MSYGVTSDFEIKKPKLHVDVELSLLQLTCAYIARDTDRHGKPHDFVRLAKTTLELLQEKE